MRHFLKAGLERLGYAVDVVGDGEEAASRWLQQPYDVGVFDLKMPKVDGVAALSRIKSSDVDAVIVLMTAHGTIATAVEAMQLGAADYVTKPFELDELQMRLERALSQRATVRENQTLRQMLGDVEGGLGLVAQSPAMAHIAQQVELMAESTATVLIGGESGTGKGLVAKAIHRASARRDGPFIALNCAAVPDNLVESELFGHEPGAFTGAVKSKAGLLQRADGGTVFLDEIGDMSLAAQAKIEGFLQDRRVLRLGGEAAVEVDVRVLAASNRDLHALAEDGAFRPELLWRLDVLNLTVPPLRDRREDIAVLIARTLERLASADRARRTITPEAIGALTAHDWPGNVRELENTIERMVALSGERTSLGLADLPAELGQEGDEASRQGNDNYEAARRRFDRIYFKNLLVECGGSITAAAQRAGISRGHLHRRLKELGTDIDAARAAAKSDEKRPG